MKREGPRPRPTAAWLSPPSEEPISALHQVQQTSWEGQAVAHERHHRVDANPNPLHSQTLSHTQLSWYWRQITKSWQNKTNGGDSKV